MLYPLTNAMLYANHISVKLGEKKKYKTVEIDSSTEMQHKGVVCKHCAHLQHIVQTCYKHCSTKVLGLTKYKGISNSYSCSEMK